PRSKPEPCFGSAAGDRLTVTRRFGSSQPLFAQADRTRSRASPRAVSGRPMRMKAGTPAARSASISTGSPRSPVSAMARVRPVGWQQHGDGIDAVEGPDPAVARAPCPAEPVQPLELAPVDRLERVAVVERGARLHLDDDDPVVVQRHDVDLAPAVRRAPVPV